jgi:hypothetical protein
MKTQQRGPFREIRWFCNDGTVLPPAEYACREHGGGYQHGAWSDRTVTLRDSGYLVANLLAGIDPDAATARPNFLAFYNQLLIEKFLIEVDDGWILREALFYRGAIQEEDERAGARALLALPCTAHRQPLAVARREYRLGAESQTAFRGPVRSRPWLQDTAWQDSRRPGCQ